MSTPIVSDVSGVSRGACLGLMNNVDLRPRGPSPQQRPCCPPRLSSSWRPSPSARSTAPAPQPPSPPPAPSVSQSASDTTGTTQIVLRLSNGTATATLTDTAGAAVRCTATGAADPARPDGPGEARAPPTAIAVGKAERTTDPEVAGPYYWPPRGDVAVVYDDLDQTVPPPGLVQLGTVTSGLPTIAAAGNRFAGSIRRPIRCFQPSCRDIAGAVSR